ncbi:hypothetical protein TIFTF001_039529 [Ficus carica]|uniref:Uncharacterized protein n=1 Tax=Ficus carica TaxID=3494 RepID=A0AA88JB59_FICCA|nr:hypothetical protein TIFTF001_039529 [Ficus carica]
MMVQKAIQNPLTKMIQASCTEQLPQVQLHQINTPSYEESAPEDSDWSSKGPTSSASNGKTQTFTLDDIPPSKWRDKFQEFKAFLILQIQKPNAECGPVILDFVSRFVANKQIAEATFGELCQLILKAIDKMCSQNKFLQEHIKQSKNLDKICINKELFTKCPSNPTLGCTCAPCSSKPSSRTKKFKKRKG